MQKAIDAVSGKLPTPDYEASQVIAGDVGGFVHDQQIPTGVQFALKPGQITEGGASLDQYTESEYTGYRWGTSTQRHFSVHQR